MTVARDGSAIDTEPLIDAHAHFYHAESGRGDWEEVNAARFRAGERIGVQACQQRRDGARQYRAIASRQRNHPGW